MIFQKTFRRQTHSSCAGDVCCSVTIDCRASVQELLSYPHDCQTGTSRRMERARYCQTVKTNLLTHAIAKNPIEIRFSTRPSDEHTDSNKTPTLSSKVHKWPAYPLDHKMKTRKPIKVRRNYKTFTKDPLNDMITKRIYRNQLIAHPIVERKSPSRMKCQNRK